MTIKCIFLFLVVKVLNEQILFVYENFRHGARFPLNKIDKDGKDLLGIKIEKKGELLKSGMRMNFLIGLKNKYKYKGLYNQYNVMADTTNYNRSILSALSQLQGMFYKNGSKLNTHKQVINAVPPNDMKPFKEFIDKLGLDAIYGNIPNVALHYVDYNLYYINQSNCPKLEEIIADNYKKNINNFNSVAINFTLKYDESFKTYFNDSNFSFNNNFNKILLYCDTFISDNYYAQNLLKELYKNIFVDELVSDCNNILKIDCYDRYFVPGSEYIKITVSNIISKLYSLLIEAKKYKNNQTLTKPVKFYMLSGHDSTIAPTLVFLYTVFKDHIFYEDIFYPKIASQLYIEYYLNNDGKDMVRCLFNDKMFLDVTFNYFINVLNMTIASQKEIDDFCFPSLKYNLFEYKLCLCIIIIFVILFGLILYYFIRKLYF